MADNSRISNMALDEDARTFWVSHVVPIPLEGETIKLCPWSPYECEIVRVIIGTDAGECDVTIRIDAVAVDLTGNNTDGSVTAGDGGLAHHTPDSPSAANRLVENESQLTFTTANVTSDCVRLDVQVVLRRTLK